MKITTPDELFFKVVFGCCCFPFLLIWYVIKHFCFGFVFLSFLGKGITEQEMEHIGKAWGMHISDSPRIAKPVPSQNMKPLVLDPERF